MTLLFNFYEAGISGIPGSLKKNPAVSGSEKSEKKSVF